MLTFPSSVIRSASLQLLRVTFVIAVSAIAVSALLIPGRAFADPPASGYTITDLGAFYPTGINNSGQVTGTQTTGNVSQAVIWNQGTITPLPFLPGGQSASASAIGNLPANASSAVLGEVVGQASDSAGHEVGTYWLNGGTATGRGGRSCYSVDEAGDIAGQVFKNDFVGDLFIYAIVWKASGTILRPLGDGTDGVISSAEAINNNGDIAGWFNPGTGASSYGYLQTSTGRNYDLRLADDTRALARAVNDNQVTVGESSHTGSIRGFVFTPDPQTITALPPLAGGTNTSAYSVNKSGDIVGYAQRSDASTGNILVSHATKWIQIDASTLVPVDLNDLLPTGSGWSNLSVATGINDNGSMIGTGTVGGGTPNAHTEAFLLSPPALSVQLFDGNQEVTNIQPSNLRLNLPRLPAAYQEVRRVYTLKIQAINPSEASQHVKIFITPQPLSGGHQHDDGQRPHGWVLKPTDSINIVAEGKKAKPGIGDYSTFDSGVDVPLDVNGMVSLRYVASEISGAEKITAALAADQTMKGEDAIIVRVPDLQPLTGNFIKLVGGGKGFPNHPDNHYGTADMITALQALAINYNDETKGPLLVNDMSLVTGGLFDIGPPNNGPFWDYGIPPKSNHIGHKIGLEADIALIPTPKGRRPTFAQSQFNRILAEQGWWKIDPAFWSSEENHYHINLSGKGKATIVPILDGGALPSPRVNWEDAAHTILDVSLDLSNHGGLAAQAVSVTAVRALYPAPRTATVTLLTKLPFSVVPMSIRQPATVMLRFSVGPQGTPLNEFILQIGGTATVADNRSFPFGSDVVTDVP